MSLGCAPAPAPVRIKLITAGSTRDVQLTHFPFTIGRLPTNDLVIDDVSVSRRHAEVQLQQGKCVLVDCNSTQGTHVNGLQIQTTELRSNDHVALGRQGVMFVFDPPPAPSIASGAQSLIGQLIPSPASESNSPISELEGLRVFLQAAGRLNRSTVVDDVLFTLLDTSLQLTNASRGFVYRLDDAGQLRLISGRDKSGSTLMDDSGVSRSILRQAVASSSKYLITDTSALLDLDVQASIVAHDLRTVLCIPLHHTSLNTRAAGDANPPLQGVLYLDSHFRTGALNKINEDLLCTIATEAAALIENARLLESEELARDHRHEMKIASGIQQQLMRVELPELSFAKVEARSVSCKEIGGDVFDIVETPEGITAALVDVSGKGVSAALLASTLQGIICAQLETGQPLTRIAEWINKFLLKKQVAGKYATMILATLRRDGSLEYLNCGHVSGVLLRSGAPQRLTSNNLPVGLLPGIAYTSEHLQLAINDKLVLVTDGVTEASDAHDEMFGDDRLCEVLEQTTSIQTLFEAVFAFASRASLDDDCTAVSLTYCG